MDAIKKKMQAMKLEKDNAMDRADACEQQAKDANLRAERVGGRIDYSLLLLYYYWISCESYNFIIIVKLVITVIMNILHTIITIYIKNN